MNLKLKSISNLIFYFIQIKSLINQVQKYTFRDENDYLLAMDDLQNTHLISTSLSYISIYQYDTPESIKQFSHNKEFYAMECIPGTSNCLFGGKTSAISVIRYVFSSEITQIELIEIDIENTNYKQDRAKLDILQIASIPKTKYFLAQSQTGLIVKFKADDTSQKIYYNSSCYDQINQIDFFNDLNIVIYQNYDNDDVFSMDHTKGTLIKNDFHKIMSQGNYYWSSAVPMNLDYDLNILFINSFLRRTYFIYDFSRRNYISSFSIPKIVISSRETTFVQLPNTYVIIYGNAFQIGYIHALEGSSSLSIPGATYNYTNSNTAFVNQYRIKFRNQKILHPYQAAAVTYSLDADIGICPYPKAAGRGPQYPCNSCYKGFNLNSRKQCVKICSGGMKYIKGEGCQSKCKNSQYENKDEICSNCDRGCETCYGPFSTNCLSCSSNKKLDPNGTCISNCPKNQYENGMKCKKCMDNCDICENNETCSRCSEGFTFFDEIKKCSKSCGAYAYYNLTTNICVSCALGCYKCFGEAHCDICETGMFIDRGMCVNECPLTRVLNKNTNICFGCSDNCLKCSVIEETNTICSLCEDGFMINNGKCISNCPEGFFDDHFLQVCLPCVENCGVCDRNSCSACVSGYFVNILGVCQKNHTFLIKLMRVSYIICIFLIGFFGWLYFRKLRKHIKTIKKLPLDRKKVEGIESYFLKNAQYVSDN